MKDERADILIYTILFANELGIDVVKEIENKILKNVETYPYDKSYGTNSKYIEL